jgi:hypothetical protein
MRLIDTFWRIGHSVIITLLKGFENFIKIIVEVSVGISANPEKEGHPLTIPLKSIIQNHNLG